MRFFSKQECQDWLTDRHKQLPEETAGLLRKRLTYPSEPYAIYSFAYHIASSIASRLPVLLWITEWGIWGSSENWHLYYRLRQSYSDMRLLHEAPGHLCLDYEVHDLCNFLQLAILNGWGGYVLSEAGYLHVFFSHDEYVDVFASDAATLEAFSAGLKT